MDKPGVLVVCDDEAGFRSVIADVLRAEGHQVVEADCLAAARETVTSVQPDLLLLDLALPDGSGIELLRQLEGLCPGCVCLIMTAHGSLSTAIDALRLGACDYLEKPTDLDDLVAHVTVLLRHRAVGRENRVLRQILADARGSTLLIAESPAYRKVLVAAKRVAERGRVALITGESGAGKEELARYIHAHSPDSQAPFVPVNLAALPDNLAESQLFGHVRGAFTGAHDASEGLVRAAAGGTLFLDEISEASAELQAKLLRLVDRSEVLAIGATRPVVVQFRLLAATNRDLKAWVAQGRFRADLFHRLNVVELQVPPLRERRPEIPGLVRSLSRDLAAARGMAPPWVRPPAARALLAYNWPGNVRELKNVLERAMILGDGREITLDDLPDEFRAAGDPAMAALDLRQATAQFERQFARDAVAAAHGDRKAAARQLGIGLSTLYRKLEETPG